MIAYLLERALCLRSLSGPGSRRIRWSNGSAERFRLHAARLEAVLFEADLRWM